MHLCLTLPLHWTCAMPYCRRTARYSPPHPKISRLPPRRPQLVVSAHCSLRREGNYTFPRNKNAALPVRAQKTPLTIRGLKENGSRMTPSATSFRAPSECHGCRRTGWSATSIPVSGDGVKTHVFMEDSIALRGNACILDNAS
jgi:hypothetical protein